MIREQSITHIGPTNYWAKVLPPDFDLLVLKYVILAYKGMVKARNYQLDWTENTFNAHLVKYLRGALKKKTIPLQVHFEEHILTNEMLDGQKNPDKAKRIDISVSGIWVTEDLFYGVEGKLLIETRFKYPANKSWTYGAGLRKRYVETGIGNFVNKNYGKSGGIIVGYVIEGNPKQLVDQINKIITKEYSKDQGLNTNPQGSFTDCYLSNHPIGKTKNKQKIMIHHLLLKMY